MKVLSRARCSKDRQALSARWTLFFLAFIECQLFIWPSSSDFAFLICLHFFAKFFLWLFIQIIMRAAADKMLSILWPSFCLVFSILFLPGRQLVDPCYLCFAAGRCDGKKPHKWKTENCLWKWKYARTEVVWGEKLGRGGWLDLTIPQTSSVTAISKREAPPGRKLTAQWVWKSLYP